MKMLMIEVLFYVFLDCEVVKGEGSCCFGLRIPRRGHPRIATLIGCSAQHLFYKTDTKPNLKEP